MGRFQFFLNIHLMLNNDLILNILKMSNVKILVSIFALLIILNVSVPFQIK